MKNELYPPHKSSLSNLDANVLALLAYLAAVVVGWIPGLRYAAWLAPLVLFFLEKNSKFVRFHAMQAFVLQVISSAIAFLVSVVFGGVIRAVVDNIYSYSLAIITGLTGLVVTLVSIAISVFAILAMVGAYNYKETHIPVVGGIAENLVKRFGT
ncbi:MAG: DUF4870 domain-containing protein [Clostridia bacterium]|nr:DUF4870 domain-containing protein [Clostridia bacterium]